MLLCIFLTIYTEQHLILEPCHCNMSYIQNNKMNMFIKNAECNQWVQTPISSIFLKDSCISVYVTMDSTLHNTCTFRSSHTPLTLSLELSSIHNFYASFEHIPYMINKQSNQWKSNNVNNNHINNQVNIHDLWTAFTFKQSSSQTVSISCL